MSTETANIVGIIALIGFMIFMGGWAVHFRKTMEDASKGRHRKEEE